MTSGDRWWIPISYASAHFNKNFSNSQPQFWMTNEDDTSGKWIPADPEEWFIVNVNQTGKGLESEHAAFQAIVTRSKIYFS
jgi:hypothetical protein